MAGLVAGTVYPRGQFATNTHHQPVANANVTFSRDWFFIMLSKNNECYNHRHQLLLLLLYSY
jgi:hypothetical protein